MDSEPAANPVRDATGTPLAVGDTVLLRCRVTALSGREASLWTADVCPLFGVVLGVGWVYGGTVTKVASPAEVEAA